MLYALVLVITTTAQAQQTFPTPDWPIRLGAGYAATSTSRKVIAYFDTERACMRALSRPDASWPPPAAGQRMEPMCIAIETEPAAR